MEIMKKFLVLFMFLFLFFVHEVNSLQCYECDSRYDDFCDTLEESVVDKGLVDCYESNSNSIGHMCVKISRSTPVTLYSRGMTRITRRCATKSDIVATGGCRYFVDEHGLYVEVCYCSDSDRCNSSIKTSNTNSLIFISILLFLIKSF